MSVTVKRTYVDSPLGQIHARTAVPRNHTKPAIVCLHMSPKSSKSYSDVLPILAVDRIAVAPDFPGHGESDPPPADPHVSVADFADSVWSVVGALDLGLVHVVGYHTGAMVAVELAVQRPTRILSIVSIGAPVYTTEERATLDSEYSAIPIDEDGTRFRVLWDRVLQHRGPGMTLQTAAASFAESLRAGDDYEWGHRAAFAYSTVYNEMLGKIDQPILVVNPADDCFEQSKRADSIMKNGERRDFLHWGHGFLNAFPRDAAGVILEFIEDVEAR